MDFPKAERKKYLKLDHQQWELVRAFVQAFFDKPEEAVKATYESLFKEIQGLYPFIVLSVSSFKKHVGSIEYLKGNAGKQAQLKIFRNNRQRITKIFHEILIGLPLEKFEAIEFEELIQRANNLYPNLYIVNQNRNTLAKNFPIKQLKCFAREQHPANQANAPIRRSVQAQDPAEPQALGPAAADIDGQRLVECQGQPDYQSARYTIVHLSCMNFTFFATETPLLPQRHYSPYPISCAAISCSKYRKMTINNYRCSS